MFERKTPVATRACVDIEVIRYFWKWICLGISFTVDFRRIVSLVGPESTLAGLTRKYAANHNHQIPCVCMLITPKSQIQIHTTSARCPITFQVVCIQ